MVVSNRLSLHWLDVCSRKCIKIQKKVSKMMHSHLGSVIILPKPGGVSGQMLQIKLVPILCLLQFPEPILSFFIFRVQLKCLPVK